jgi:hypothetical protein
MNFKSRDFLDKRIYFKHDDTYYIYCSEVPNTLKAPEKEFERGSTAMALFKIRADPSSGSVHFWSAS